MHSASDQSYNLNVPAKALVNRAGQDHVNLRDYECGWYIPTSLWPPGLEESLVALCAPWLPAQESKVAAAVEKCTTFEQRIEQCLVTSEGSLKAIRHILSVSLCNAAATPLGKDGELLDEEPIWKQFAHPIFNAAVFSSESFAILETMVRENQKSAEERRRDPPTLLTSQEFRATATAMQSNIIQAINNARVSDPGTAAAVATTAVENIIATATGNAADARSPTDTGTSASTGTSTGATPALPSTHTRAVAAATTATAASTANPADNAKTRRGSDRQIKPKTNRQMQSAEHYMKMYQKKGSFYCQNENLMTIRDV